MRPFSDPNVDGCVVINIVDNFPNWTKMIVLFELAKNIIMYSSVSRGCVEQSESAQAFVAIYYGTSVSVVPCALLYIISVPLIRILLYPSISLWPCENLTQIINNGLSSRKKITLSILIIILYSILLLSKYLHNVISLIFNVTYYNL